ncbi:MAG: ABC transporter permease [Tenericutes bacterium GWC2_34_14]|nr:MAG: ABC transporter permease [Tenericutes bacterium GWC2_34_14]OHE34781.1 MAG: ABC transporter permease [Tenericutes bacterium GWE2_34_108]OHE37358.1 MAG: ABC transporter permease [Tenericutes bacterium GWF1_35_14]OHE39509.1 MAG: ABC transporter permease [Tenericutes bacterium GWF2_35_184]OHE44302.1 MAG: ABC transporter permease [Tenericutes bacterium RIFOXYA2_FULL_36_32]OHE45554.1 MAG: ABC transporter permease [Tenericutes bacterium RIFOXYA12_FULL_35_10]OHE47272.1 MAG: ABC transporter pe
MTGINFNPQTFHKSQIKFYLILLPFAIFMAMPIVYIFSTAFKPIYELFAFPPRFLVQQPTLKNFRDLFVFVGYGLPVMKFIVNSLIVTLLVVFSSVLFSSMAGYILSKKNFKGRKLLFEINKLALMFVPIAVTIPRFLVITNIGIIDTMFAHVLPMIAIPVGLFLVKQFIDQIPNELIEAAKVDGAGDFYIYTKIIVPLSMPAIATIAILSFQATWNNTETSTLFVNDEIKQTFAFYMATLTNISNSVAAAGIGAAATLIMFLPNLIIFIIMQSRVMSTMSHSGLK